MDYKSKVPPHSIEAEQSVLGAMINEKDIIVDVIEIIQTKDFYRETHQVIFEHILKLFDNADPIETITLSDSLVKDGKLDVIGGMAYLTELSNIGVITATASHHAKIIQQKSILRQLINASSDIIQNSYESKEARDVLEQAEKAIFDISKQRNKKDMMPIKEVLKEAFEKIEKLSQNQGVLTGLTTGFIDLDEKTNGLQRSDLVLIAARPSMGKTAFALNICQNVAQHTDGDVVIFSLEMAKEQLVHRMISASSHVSLKKIKQGDLSEQSWGYLAKGMGALSNSNIYIDDTPAMTVMEIRAKCRRRQLHNRIDLIMIDYLQLMQGKGESRQVEVSNISRGLKALAREMDCPVIALSQLSRAPDQRTDHRPMLSDLRESGAIEQDADVVMFLYRDEYYYQEESDKKGIGEVIIAKQRNGETGRIELVWLSEFTQFVNKSRENEG